MFEGNYKNILRYFIIYIKIKLCKINVQILKIYLFLLNVLNIQLYSCYISHIYDYWGKLEE